MALDKFERLNISYLDLFVLTVPYQTEMQSRATMRGLLQIWRCLYMPL